MTFLQSSPVRFWLIYFEKKTYYNSVMVMMRASGTTANCPNISSELYTTNTEKFFLQTHDLLVQIVGLLFSSMCSKHQLH